MELESDFEDIEDAVQETHAPSLVDWSAATAQNANLYKTSEVDIKTKGVHSAPNSFVLHEVEDGSDDDNFPPKMVVDYDSDDSDDSDDKSDEPPVPGMPPLMTQNDGDDDADNVVMVEDVLDDDEAYADVSLEVGPEQLGRWVRARRTGVPYQTSFNRNKGQSVLSCALKTHHFHSTCVGIVQKPSRRPIWTIIPTYKNI